MKQFDHMEDVWFVLNGKVRKGWVSAVHGSNVYGVSYRSSRGVVMGINMHVNGLFASSEEVA